MTYFGLDWDRPIKEEYEINEYEDQTGAPWLEVFPYVFVEVDMNAQPVWERFELRNPEIEGMRLTAPGDNSGYRATPSQFFSAIDFLVSSVPWLRDVNFVEDDEINIAKVLAHISVARSHDALGARWIDRLTWIDTIAVYVTEENRDNLRRADFARNTALFRELNWLSVVVTASKTSFYREITMHDFENWELNSPALNMAFACDVNDDDFADFIDNQCENSMIRDLAVAHLLFEDAVDPMPEHAVDNSYSRIEMSRSHSRGLLNDRLRGSARPDFWAIRTMFIPPEIRSDLKQIFDVLCSFTIESAEERLGRIVEVILKTEDDSDVYSDDLEYYDMILMFIGQHREWFPRVNVNLSWMSTERFDLAKKRSEWVFDEVAFFDYAPTLDLTRYQQIGSNYPVYRKAATGTVPAAALVLAVLGFMSRADIHEVMYNLSQLNRPTFRTRFDDGPLGEHVKAYYQIYSEGNRNNGV
jgi:hypothetical protein